MKKAFPTLLSLLFFLPLWSQTTADQLLPVKIEGKFGYINYKNEVIITPQFYWADGFREGLAVAQALENDGTGGLFGYIDSTGRWTIFPVFSAATEFSHGWARVKQDDSRFIYIDKTGRMPIPKRFFECYAVQHFPIPVREQQGSKAGFINEKGEYVIAPTFDVAHPFMEGLAVVAIGEKRGFINEKGDFVIPPTFYRANYFQNGRAKVIIKNTETGEKKEGFINLKGELCIPATFEVGNAQDFSEGLAAVCPDALQKKWGFITPNGEWAIEPQFDRVGAFHEGVAKAQLNGKFGFINPKGEWVIAPKYDNVSDFKDGIASVFMKNERMGYINQKADFVWKADKPAPPAKEKKQLLGEY